MFNNIGLFSYGAACFAYILLAVALFRIWRNRVLSMSAMLATVATVAWAGVISAGTLLPEPPILLLETAEVARNSAWIFVLTAMYSARLGSGDHVLASQRWLPWFFAGLALIVILLVAAPIYGSAVDAPQSLVRALVYSIWLTMSLIGLLLLENIYRGSTESERWGRKYLVMGVGFVFGYDFLMYTDALIVGQIDAVIWQSRGFAIALTAPLIAVAAARSRDRRANANQYRHVVFHTFTLLVAGMYLIFMAVLGYFISYFGGTWSGVLQLTFLSAAALLLVTLLFSGRVRARSRVWFSKNFFNYKYDYRREWLEFTETLAEAGDSTPQAVIQAMAKLSHCRAGELWTRTEDGSFSMLEQWNTPRSGDPPEIPAFNQWLQENDWIVDVQEWRESPEIYVGLEMPEMLAKVPGAWLAIPLMFSKRLEGVLFLRRSESHVRLNWEDRDLLKVAARQAASNLVQFRTGESLAELRQFEAFNRLSAYVVHDLKNILAQQSLIVPNAARHRNNPEFFDDVMDTVADSVERMTRLMEQMTSGARGERRQRVNLAELLDEAVAARADQLPRPVLESSAGDLWVEADRGQLGTVFGHIIQNAMEATDKHGSVCVRLSAEADMAHIDIEDDGIGMSADFVKRRLFKPFDSTKGLTGMGIGASESREFLRRLGGTIKVTSEEGVGSCFHIVLPCVKAKITIKSAPEVSKTWTTEKNTFSS